MGKAEKKTGKKIMQLKLPKYQKQKTEWDERNTCYVLHIKFLFFCQNIVTKIIMKKIQVNEGDLAQNELFLLSSNPLLWSESASI